MHIFTLARNVKRLRLETCRSFTNSSQVSRKERDTTDVNLLTFTFPIWISDSVIVMGCILAVLHGDCCPETPSDRLDFTYFRATEKHICYVSVPQGEHACLREHSQSWTHWEHFFGSMCLATAEKHPQVRVSAIFLPGVGWAACVGFL